MATGRISKAQREREALEEFGRMPAALPDPRRKQGQRYPFESVIVIALMSMVCGADDASGMEVWGELNEEFLSGFLPLPHGTPSQDVFLAVFAALKPEAFNAMFLSWMELLKGRLSAVGRHIAVDGKTSRRSFDFGKEQPAIHTVSAWLSDEGLVLGQFKTREKSNEITAIPELLKMIDLRSATVTVDALGCQTEIAEEIVAGGGDYLLAVKENQPTLHADIQEAFEDAVRTPRQPMDPPLAVERWLDTTKGHGRIEERTLLVCRDLSWITTRQRWSGLAFVARMESTRTDVRTGRSSTEHRYFIGSDSGATCERIGQLIRRHWGIENELHWVLDMAFREDEARHRARNCAANFSTLRHFTLNLIKNAPNRKLGIPNSRKRAGWDRSYLIELITGWRP